MPLFLASFFSDFLGASLQKNMWVGFRDNQDGHTGQKATKNGQKPETLR